MKSFEFKMKFLIFLILIVAVLLKNVTCDDEYNYDKSLERSPYNRNLTLEERLEIEKSIFHWLPYKRIYYMKKSDGTLYEQTCPERNPAINEFPTGWWTREQRLRGRFLLHIFAAVYFFIVLAFICDKYFLPTVERICTVLNISPDVAATTFMATATTTPEFFSNTISTFIAESDMGLSAIVGSMLFNTLGVAACASLFAKKPIQIDWWPISRDAILFSINVIVLVVISWDGAVMWWETCILMTLYVLYWILMFQNKRIMKFVKNIVEERLMWCQRIKNYDIANQCPLNANTENPSTSNSQVESSPAASSSSKNSYAVDNLAFTVSTTDITKIYSETYRKRRESADIIEARRARRESTDLAVIYAEEEEEEYKIWELPSNASAFDWFWFFFTWPIRFSLHYTIPNPIKYKKLFPLSFIMCIVWIGCTSYMVFWMVVIIGDTFRIPDPIMGLTFLAFGGCMPEAISAVIVARKGSGQMGVSNALGANCLAILFCLGLPWFIQTMIDGAGWTGAYIRIYSYGIEYTIMAIILAILTLYIVIAAAGYKLRKRVGGILGLFYLLFAAFAILVELEILFTPTERC